MIAGAHRELALLSAIADGGLSQRGLSQRAGLSLGGTNKLLRKLVSSGRVRTIAVDRRSTRYELTPQGRAAGRRLALLAADRALGIARSLAASR